jgi:hypothetical protein
LKSLLLALAALGLGLLLCEGLLSLIYPQVYRRPPRVWQFDADLGWAHVPAGKGRLVTPEFNVEIRINADGLRDGDYARQKSGNTRRVLVFGDSFAEGWGVEVEESLSKRLEVCLRDRGSRAAEVINFGVAGYGTDQELLLFEKLGRHYQADVVVVLFYGNDLWNNASRRGIGAERGYKPFFKLGLNGRLALGGTPVTRTAYWDESRYSGGSWRTRLKRYFYSHWHVYVLLEKALRDKRPPKKQSSFYDGLYGRDPQGRWTPAWELSGHLLKAFDEAVRRADAQLVLVYAPAILQIEAEDWQRKRELHGLVGEYDLAKPNAQLAAFATRYGLSYLDLYFTFKARAEGEVLYLRDSHWNAAGHALAAENLCKHLLASAELWR